MPCLKLNLHSLKIMIHKYIKQSNSIKLALSMRNRYLITMVVVRLSNLVIEVETINNRC